MVDLERRRLRVVRVLVEVGGRIAVKPYPKSRAGRRVVPVPTVLAEMLTRHRDEFPSPEWVFTNSAAGPVGRTSFRTRVWKPAIRRAGLPERLRFHDLRHAYATWLVSEGVPPNIVQRIMGHEDVTTTLAIYTDVPDDYVGRVDGVFCREANVTVLEDRFRQHVMEQVRRLRDRYNPAEFLIMVSEHGAVGATKRLLADPRHTSYGFERLHELGALDASVEFAVSLSWFQPLFRVDEVEEAERRLLLHEFPLRERLARAERTPPAWSVDPPLTDEDET